MEKWKIPGNPKIPAGHHPPTHPINSKNGMRCPNVSSPYGSVTSRRTGTPPPARPSRHIPFVLAIPDHGRKIITATNILAQQQGIETGMVVADAKAIFPSLKVIDDDPTLPEKLLKSIAKFCIRYTDAVAIDLPDGLILDVTGCAHLWGGEKNYITEINTRLTNRGYDIRATIATPSALPGPSHTMADHHPSSNPKNIGSPSSTSTRCTPTRTGSHRSFI